jgi:hypothetical protein
MRKSGGDDERIRARGDNVRDLLVHLFPVAVEPPAGNGSGDAVEGDDVRGGEEAVEDEADNATEGVLSEQIEGIIDAQIEFG